MFEYENRFMSRSSSIVDNREPYEIVIEKNLRSRTKRLQDDTREELSKVLERVENTLHEYERNTTMSFDPRMPGTNIEFLVDFNELQEILNDKVSKFKYKQQITVFIVGQCEAIERKNILLEQINDFFNDQRQNFDPKDLNETNFDFELDTVKEEFEDAVDTAKIMGTRIEELNENIIQYLIANTGSKQAKALIERSRKKLEKSLKDSKDEITGMTERLTVLQAEVNLRDDKIKNLIKQLEAKNKELKGKQGIPDSFKQSTSSMEPICRDNESGILRVKIRKMQQEIKALNRKLTKSGIEITDLSEELNEIAEEEKKDDQISEQVETDQIDMNIDFKGNDFEIKEIDVLKYKFEQDVISIKKEYEAQLELITNKLKEADAELAKFKKKPKPKGKILLNNKNKFNKNQKKPKEKSIEIDLNEEQENLDKLEQNAENEKQLKMIDEIENGGVIEDIDLTTDDWVNVNPTEISKRYDMLRRYATAKINALKNSYETLETTDKEKIEKLKKQYFDHKKLWETEKLVLLNVKDMELNWDQERSDFLDQAEIAYKLQVQAQDAAESAIKQLEEFITEDAKLDRESAENTIQILRERSRTYTSFSIGNKDDHLDDENEFQNSKKMSTEKSEKIQVMIENFSIKFPNKHVMDKIIEYINFESSNKYTLILNHAQLSNNNANNSRPTTRNEKTSTNSQSPTRKPSSLKNSLNRESSNHKSNERKSAKQQKNSDNDKFDNSLEAELVEQVLSKVLTDDEAMLVELRNSVRSRNSLRTKHLAQLEANKERLNEIKNMATQKLIGMDQDLPLNEDDFNRSHSLKRDATSARVKVASEAVLNRVSSSKTLKSSMNSSIISHPIVLEYIKTYDIVINFKNLVLKHIPLTDQNDLFKQFIERLSGLKTIDYDQDMTITPQIINMTSNIDSILNEIKIIFSELIDEAVALKYDLLEKEQYLAMKPSRPNTSMSKIDLEVQKLEVSLKEKEVRLNHLEVEINKKIERLKQENDENEQIKSMHSKNLAFNSSTLLLNAPESPKSLIAPAPSFIYPDAHENENNFLVVKKKPIETKKFNLKDAYATLEVKYEMETKMLRKQIEEYKIEYEKMSKKIQEIKNDEKSETGGLVLPPIKRKSLDMKSDYVNKMEKFRVVLFTRVDALQNEKRLKNALTRGAITENDYNNVKTLMESYISVQESRLVELMKFYMNLKRMKSIKETIRSQDEESVNTEKILENMQKIHDKRVTRYMDKVKKLKENRINLASQLTDTLVDIEQQSGIFLVKPFCSYKGLDPTVHLMKINKLTRSASARREELRPVFKNSQNQPIPMFYQRPALTDPNLIEPKILGQANWSMGDSLVHKSNDSKKAVRSASEIGVILDTPKILEIDINRMMISQNQIAATINPNDRLAASVRSYLAFNRPSLGIKKDDYQDSDLQFNRLSRTGRNLNSPSLPPIDPNKGSNQNDQNKKVADKPNRPNT